MSRIHKIGAAAAALTLSVSLLAACSNSDKNETKETTSTSETTQQGDRFDKAEAQKKVDNAIDNVNKKIDEGEKAVQDFYNEHTSEQTRDSIKNTWESAKEAGRSAVDKAKNLDFSKENIVNNTVDALNAADRALETAINSVKK